MNCSKCGKELPEGSSFCDSCGTPVDEVRSLSGLCPRCGVPLEADAAFCANCGYQTTGSSKSAAFANVPEQATKPAAKKTAPPKEPEEPITAVAEETTKQEIPATPEMVELKQKAAPAAKKPKKGLIIAVVAVAVILIAGGIAAALLASNSKKKQPAQSVVQTQKNTGGTGTTSNADNANVYDSVIKAYQAYQSSGFTDSGSILNTSLIGVNGSEAIVFTEGDRSTLVYTLKDINNDGTPELLVSVQDPSFIVSYFDLWTAADGEAVLLFSPNHNTQSMSITTDGELETVGKYNSRERDSLPASSTKLETKPGNKDTMSITLQWTPITDWKFADGSTATASTPAPAATIYTPEKSSPERQALMDAARTEGNYTGQFIVSSLFSNGEWAIGDLGLADTNSNSFDAAGLHVWHKVNGSWVCIDNIRDGGPDDTKARLKSDGLPDSLIEKGMSGS